MLNPSSLYDQCHTALYMHGKPDLPALYRELADYAEQNQIDCDVYGEGSFLNRFEADMATLLGKPAAVFMPSGVMAQQIALRIRSDQSGLPQVGYHPTSHLELNEQHGYHFLHGLQANLLGEPHRLIEPQDFEALEKPCSTLLIELPQRWIGGQLPDWQNLQRVLDAAKEKMQYFHLDGARLWETEPFYQQPVSDTAKPFSSVYVSFYKTLGSFSGALLAGDEDFIEQARVWLRRHGGNLNQLHPYAISARLNLDKCLSLIPDYVTRAKQLAELLNNHDLFTVNPEPPHCNLFHLHIQASEDKLLAARDQIAADDGIWLCGKFAPSYLPKYNTKTHRYMEIHVGDVLLNMSDDEVSVVFDKLLTLIQ